MLVPGTSRLLEHDLSDSTKKGTSKIVLVPRPSDSPLDPLVRQLRSLSMNFLMIDLMDRDGRRPKKILHFSRCAFRSL